MGGGGVTNIFLSEQPLWLRLAKSRIVGPLNDGLEIIEQLQVILVHGHLQMTMATDCHKSVGWKIWADAVVVNLVGQVASASVHSTFALCPEKKWEFDCDRRVSCRNELEATTTYIHASVDFEENTGG